MVSSQHIQPSGSICPAAGAEDGCPRSKAVFRCCALCRRLITACGRPRNRL